MMRILVAFDGGRERLEEDVMHKGSVFAISAGLTLASAVAYASSVHVKSGPFFIDNGLTLTATGELAGLGLQDVVIGMTATAKPIATCTNPSGQNQPPGQNPAQVAVSATPQAIPAAEIKNGNTPYSLTTNPPTSPIPGAADCPNPNWTETITDLQFTSATITVQQPPPTVVLTVECTFAPPTINGSVSRQTVSCSSFPK
jgi:hypothetical protein